MILRKIETNIEQNIFMDECQNAFQKAFEHEYGVYDKKILPNEDIQESFDTEGARVYFAEIENERVGGVLAVIDEETGNNSLHLLYVNGRIQNKGVGYAIWKEIERLYPDTKVWETHTPYFDKRNIHFYVNRCGFKIVEFFNPRHSDPHLASDTAGNIPSEHNYFFRFEKEMN